ncbi:MAG: thiamine phosphate synthase [Thermoanaerobacter sp.]|nr:thiamine phosphate synthase [Thermoanaerobacter sp.]
MGDFYRVLDANFNRAREGLRVVEEVARFILDDPQITMRIRKIRHRLGLLQEKLTGQGIVLVEARDVCRDVAAPAPPAAGEEKINLLQLITANFKRVQEAVRVLEEYARLLPFPAPFKEIRYEVYALEQEMAGRLVRPGTGKVPGRVDYSLYVITGDKFSRGRPLVEVVRAAIEGGATVIQLREKDFTARQLVDAGHQLRRLTREKGVTFIVNDRVDIALAVEADGVHLGQDDLPVGMARKILGPGKIIGVSTHSVEQAMEAQRQGADYIGVGPVFETRTKDDVQAPVGVDLVRQVASVVSIPKVAIGGIKAYNVEEVIAAGADGVAVITAVVAAEDISGAARELRSRIDRTRR